MDPDFVTPPNPSQPPAPDPLNQPPQQVPPIQPPSPVAPPSPETQPPLPTVAPTVSSEPALPVSPEPTPAPIPSTPPAPAEPAQPMFTPQYPPGPEPAPGIVVGGGDLITPNPPPVSPYESLNDPLPPLPSKRNKKPLFIGLAAAVILIGAAAFYFGYYNNPSVIYSQSLKNTGKGYSKLIDYFNTQSQAKYKGSEGNGSYSLKSSSFSTDGKLAFQSDGSNGELTFDVGVGVGRVSADVRYFKSSSDTPDIYVKAAGLKGLGGLLGTPQLDAAVNKLDNTWIAIDHTTLDNLQSSAASMVPQAGSSKTPATPSKDQILDELHAFGTVNQQYLFSTDKNKAVTTVVKKYGSETVGGHKTYHYKVALVKDNVKKYLTAQQTALKSSKLGAWLKQNDYESTVDASFDSMRQSANNIKSSDTFEVWADKSQHIIYKLRFTDPKNNPAENYVDVGLDYKGGDNYPFFISGQSKSDGLATTGSLAATLNTKDSSLGFKANLKTDGSFGSTFTSDFVFKPSNATVKISKPATSQTLAQALNELGVGNVLNSYLQAPAAPSTANPL